MKPLNQLGSIVFDKSAIKLDVEVIQSLFDTSKAGNFFLNRILCHRFFSVIIFNEV